MSSGDLHTISSQIKSKALELGFDACGIAPVKQVDEKTAKGFQKWISDGRHGKMLYMARNVEKRLNPAELVPKAKSIICLAMNYHCKDYQPENAFYKVSQYAAGTDYHDVIKKKLYSLLEYIQSLIKIEHARVFTDSAPVMERYWAQQAGLGAPGKNTCLILPGKGSFFFLGEIILNNVLHYDEPFEKDMCGKCTRCIEACPTAAITGPGKIDATRCISYLTIELKEQIPEKFKDKMQNHIFGCDICQDVCPHNIKFAGKSNEPDFHPLPAISLWSKSDWEEMDKSEYRKQFIKTRSPIARAAYLKLFGNIQFIRDLDNSV